MLLCCVTFSISSLCPHISYFSPLCLLLREIHVYRMCHQALVASACEGHWWEVRVKNENQARESRPSPWSLGSFPGAIVSFNRVAGSLVPESWAVSHTCFLHGSSHSSHPVSLGPGSVIIQPLLALTLPSPVFPLSSNCCKWPFLRNKPNEQA